MIANLLVYILFVFAILLIAPMPFAFMYKLSDFLAYILHKTLRYRLIVVRRNFLQSFPNKSKDEIIRIEKEFYKNLTDTTLEAIKGFILSESAIRRRYTVSNPEILEKHYQRGESVILVTGHLNNWEWGPLAASYYLKHKPIAFYNKLTNPFIDKLVKRSRERKGTVMVSISETEITFEETKNEVSIYILVSDQSPSDVNKAFWVNFLNQDTPCLHVPEKYAHLYNYPVYFIDIKRIKRGYYNLQLSQITTNPRQLNFGELTSIYMSKLENVIIDKPESWLWSHRRWKRKRPSFIKSDIKLEHNPV